MKKIISLIALLALFSCIIEIDNEDPCEGFNGKINEDCATVTSDASFYASSENTESIKLDFRFGGGGANYVGVSVQDSDSTLQEILYSTGTTYYFSEDGYFTNPSLKVTFTQIDRTNRTVSGAFSFTSDSYTDSSFGTRKTDDREGTFKDVKF